MKPTKAKTGKSGYVGSLMAKLLEVGDDDKGNGREWMEEG